jgi:tetratricopeptide (TPR) repeat protein
MSAMLTERWLIRLAALLLMGLYLRAVGFAPVYDDNVINPWDSWSDLPKFFTHDIFGTDGTAHSVYYRPLAMTWGFLILKFSGGAPGWFHLSAILLHLTVVALAYVFGRQLFRDDRLAMLTALLFGLHPSKVESVAWIGSSCVDGLGAVFFFGSLIMFLKWSESKSGRFLSASVLLFACAMFTKETMVFVPILIAVYLWLTLPHAGRVSRILRTLLPYGIVWVVYMVIRHQIIKPPSAGAEYMHPTFTLNNLWTAPYSIWWYIRHLALPWGLSVEYANNVLVSPKLLGFVLPGIGLLVLFAGAVWLWSRRRSPVAAFLMFWFVLTLAPPVILAPMVSEHDRYLYIPAYAFCALIAWVILYFGKLPSSARLIIALGVVLLWSGLTWHEMGYWDCEKTLWSRVLEIAPSQSKARLMLASIYKDEDNVPKALSILDDGLRYNQSSLKLLMAQADIFSYNKQNDDARASYLKIMEITEPAAGEPVDAGLKTRLRAAAAYRLAEMDISANNFVEAERYIRTALSLDANGVGYHAVLSKVLLGEGHADEAKAENALELHLRLTQRKRVD